MNASWDWGGGDWETGLGAAAHMGRRDIAELLLGRGARLDLFAAAIPATRDRRRCSARSRSSCPRKARTGSHCAYTPRRAAKRRRPCSPCSTSAQCDLRKVSIRVFTRARAADERDSVQPPRQDLEQLVGRGRRCVHLPGVVGEVEAVVVVPLGREIEHGDAQPRRARDRVHAHEAGGAGDADHTRDGRLHCRARGERRDPAHRRADEEDLRCPRARISFTAAARSSASRLAAAPSELREAVAAEVDRKRRVPQPREPARVREPLAERALRLVAEDDRLRPAAEDVADELRSVRRLERDVRAATHSCRRRALAGARRRGEHGGCKEREQQRQATSSSTVCLAGLNGPGEARGEPHRPRRPSRAGILRRCSGVAPSPLWLWRSRP